VLTARHYAGLAAGFLALAVYGSLVPFHFHPLPWGEAVARFRAALAEGVHVGSRSDWAANILLFIPLGFLAVGALAVDRPRWAGALAVLAVVPVCALLSAAIEFTQLFFPPRVTSLNDITAESLGGAVGALFWLVAGQPLTDRLRRLWADLGGRDPVAALLAAYVAALLVAEALPLDFTISPADLYHKYRDGRVFLVPFARRGVAPLEQAQKDVENVLLFLPVGLLLAGLGAAGRRPAAGWTAALGVGLGLAGLVEFTQLFVHSRYFDATDVLTGGLTVLAGWGLRRAWQRAAPSAEARASAAALLCAWAAALAFANWQPFGPLASPGEAAARLRAMPLLPFVDYQSGNYLHALDEATSKALLFVPVGALLVACRPGRGAVAAALLAAGFAAVLEAGQLFVPGRYASVTDVLVEALGAWAGAAAYARAARHPRVAGPSDRGA
jgi:VanZ family protein